MPPTDYTYYISENLFISVHIEVALGRVTNFVIKLHCIIGGKAFEIIRFDTAHGSIHKDILRPDGTKDRVVSYPYLTNNTRLDFAIKELEEHAEFYFERFVK